MEEDSEKILEVKALWKWQLYYQQNKSAGASLYHG